LRVDYEHGWKHVRSSRTERIIRIISESKDRDLAEKEAETIIRIVEEVL
jgi:phosphomannomutase